MEPYAYKTKTLFQRFTGHLKTVLIHKKYVSQGCFRIGLYYQGIVHDLSKFTPVEFMTGVRYYDGHRSPNAVERQLFGASEAWLHHKGRNRHHFEYWVDFTADPVTPIRGCRMPLKYVAEMVCDRRAACIAYHGADYAQGDAWAYYVSHRDKIVMHPDTRAVLEKALVLMRDEGEDAAFRWLKDILSVTKGRDYTAALFGLDYQLLD